ncbi:MAG: hypothetical protein L3J83_06365, partial [Proteobacteria bacterium]|nr:hypothetical protein [Pseudomonadota bacterium]
SDFIKVRGHKISHKKTAYMSETILAEISKNTCGTGGVHICPRSFARSFSPRSWGKGITPKSWLNLPITVQKY